MAVSMQDMVASLATMPESQRRTMMEDRLKMFYEMPDDRRQQAMKGMIEALHGLSDKELRKLVKTRTEVLCTFTPEQRNPLMGIHMQILEGLGQEGMMREMGGVEAIMPELSPEDRKIVQAMMSRMKGGIPAQAEEPAKAAAPPAGMSMGDMVAALAKQPEEGRRAMMEERLNMFYEMDNAQREKSMRMMLQALQGLPENDFYKIVRTRTRILADFPAEKRKTLMQTHMGILQTLPEKQRMQEMQIVQEAIQGLPAAQKQVMMSAMQGMTAMKPQAAPAAQPASRPAPTPRPATHEAAPGWVSPVRWLTVALGAWAIVMAFIFDFGGTAGVVAQIAGGLVAGVFPLINNLYWLSALGGVWLIVAPFIFGYGSTALVLSIITGAVIVVLAGVLAVRTSS